MKETKHIFTCGDEFLKICFDVFQKLTFYLDSFTALKRMLEDIINMSDADLNFNEFCFFILIHYSNLEFRDSLLLGRIKYKIVLNCIVVHRKIEKKKYIFFFIRKYFYNTCFIKLWHFVLQN